MAGAVDGIYGNSKEEALYVLYFTDSNGQKLNGSTDRYVLRFAPGQMPPVHAFWSLTMYGLPSRLLVANPLSRHVINSASLPDLELDADGGLTLYIQHESPGIGKERNWLPAPDGPFLAKMRMYWPNSEALRCPWKRPQLVSQPKYQPVRAVETPRIVTIKPVTADNFIRAETDMHFGLVVKKGGFGKFKHHRELMPVDNQTVVRGNRDTVSSSAVFDLAAGPVTITLPDAGKRFRSLVVIDEDQYVSAVVHDAGCYTFSREQIGTRYVLIGMRILIDPANSQDVRQVHALQDAIEVSQKSPGRFEVPAWDQSTQKKVRDALLVLGATLPDLKGAFGVRGQVDPVRHLIGTAMEWGSNSEKDAVCLSVTPSRNDGSTIYRLNVKEVPVDGFWSISVYNAQGYFQPNKYDAYTLNSTTAMKADDGSIAVQFGGWDGKTANCLPIVKGWNYVVRLYRPRAEILNGDWSFPHAQPARAERAA
jgi:hypothetical protein